jgi:hypothetical protein
MSWHKLVLQSWADLEGSSIPPHVLSFLKAAHMEGGAVLESLNPEVVQWLQERGSLPGTGLW